MLLSKKALRELLSNSQILDKVREHKKDIMALSRVKDTIEITETQINILNAGELKYSVLMN